MNLRRSRRLIRARDSERFRMGGNGPKAFALGVGPEMVRDRMSMSAKWVGGITLATVVLVGSQLVRDREKPSWTSAARSVAAVEPEKARASTAASPSTPDAAEAARPPEASLPAIGRALQGERRDAPAVRDVRLQPERAPASDGAANPEQPDARTLTAARDSAAPAHNRPAASAPDDNLEDIEPRQDVEAEPRRGGRARKTAARKPSLRFASRAGRCGARCSSRSARASLPTRRNPIQFQLADRGTR
jgi:hypothetical protein